MKKFVTKFNRYFVSLIILCALVAGCSCSGDRYYFEGGTDDILLTYFDPDLPDGTLQFSHSIMNEGDFDRIIPLGQINPPGHTFPTDHIYFVLNGLERSVYAPCSGKILYIEESGMYNDGAIRIGVTNTMAYYLGHIFVNENLKVGDSVSAGDEIAKSGNTSCVDFGVLNKNINNGFLNQKHPPTTIYGDKPLFYYAEPLRSTLYALVKGPQPPENPEYVYDQNVTDGDFALDLAGTLCGNWFEENSFRADGWYDWDKTLAFGYDVLYPDQIIIGSGKYQYPFALKNEDNPISPENVNTSSGAVAYYLYNGHNTSIGLPTGSRIGLMMVEMLSDTRIKLEIFDDVTSEIREFTTSALIYVR